jgi:hypothetical protein
VHAEAEKRFLGGAQQAEAPERHDGVVVPRERGRDHRSAAAQVSEGGQPRERWVAAEHRQLRNRVGQHCVGDVVGGGRGQHRREGEHAPPPAGRAVVAGRPRVGLVAARIPWAVDPATNGGLIEAPWRLLPNRGQIFLDKNRRDIGKSQSKRPPKRTC